MHLYARFTHLSWKWKFLNNGVVAVVLVVVVVGGVGDGAWWVVVEFGCGGDSIGCVRTTSRLRLWFVVVHGAPLRLLWLLHEVRV